MIINKLSIGNDFNNLLSLIDLWSTLGQVKWVLAESTKLQLSLEQMGFDFFLQFQKSGQEEWRF